MRNHIKYPLQDQVNIRCLILAPIIITAVFMGLVKKFIWDFSMTAYGKPQTNILANPISYLITIKYMELVNSDLTSWFGL